MLKKGGMYRDVKVSEKTLNICIFSGLAVLFAVLTVCIARSV